VISSVRIGAVSYLNTKPLVHGLHQRLPQAEIAFDLPSRLADGLQSGRYDVALIPSVEYFRMPGVASISTACIGCRGPVWSVKLVSRVPCDQIKTLALDEGSRTSAALVQVLLQDRFGVRPALLPFPIDVPLEHIDADAVLIIGDRAMHLPATGWHTVWDLGQEWNRQTGLPFVFALWVASRVFSQSKGAIWNEVETALNASRDDGVGQLAAIAANEAANYHLDEAACLSYLRDNLYFFLGPREHFALGDFRKRAASLGLISKPSVPESTTSMGSPTLESLPPKPPQLGTADVTISKLESTL
jgi:chorismate dehydratase